MNEIAEKATEDADTGVGETQHHKVQQLLICLVSVMIVLSIIMTYSVSVGDIGTAGDTARGLQRHMFWVIIATIGLVLAYGTDYRKLAKYRNWFILISAALLIAVFIPGIGRRVNNASRWIRIAGFSFQPSEFAKLAVILYIASFIADSYEKLTSFREGFLPLILPTGLLCLLIIIEPDVGTALFVAAVTGVMLFVGGVRLKHILITGALTAIPAVIFVLHRFSHVRERFSIFFSPTADPLGKGYQIRQSLIAIGSGGPFGLGLGASRQKLLFLPDRDTDFVFSILGEELGLIGTGLVIFIFIMLIFTGVAICRRCKDRLGSLLAFGLVFSICFQAAVNIAVVTASVPTKGIVLPFLSSGGTSLCATMVAVGILLNISSRSDTITQEERE